MFNKILNSVLDQIVYVYMYCPLCGISTFVAKINCENSQ